MKLDEAGKFDVDIRHDIEYARRGDRLLAGDLYVPRKKTDVPLLVAFHGGGWKRGDRGRYRHIGAYLARRGIAVFSAGYRFVNSEAGTATYLAAVADARAAVKFMRKNADRFGVDPERIGVIGDSAGAHLAALVALAGDRRPFDALDTDEPAQLASTPCRVSVAIGIYGVYDMLAQWRYDQCTRPRDHITEQFLGVSAIENRAIYHEASPLTYATTHANTISFFLAWGTADDIVDPDSQSKAFLEALKQAGYFVRTAILTDAPHFWIGDPIDEAHSHTAWLAPRLFRFLIERL